MAKWLGAAVAVVAAAALVGCSTPVAPPQSDLVDEISAHHGRVCPVRLPPTEDPNDHNLGTVEHADARPSLLEPEQAWICRYDSTDLSERPHSRVRATYWKRHGGPHRVDHDRLGKLTGYLDRLRPAGDQACTSDLGPSFMLVYAHDRDLTGVLVESYGCQDVRLTDDPFTTAPGDPGQVGTVAGVLTAPGGLLDILQADFR
jgi:hypothetical protein